jgi:hypothetical protein
MTESIQQLGSGEWLPIKLKALYYGPQSVEKHLISSLPSPNSKAFIVTGNSLATKTGLIKQVEQLLKGNFNSTKLHMIPSLTSDRSSCCYIC